MIWTSAQSVARLELVTGDREASFFEVLPLWAWVVVGVGALLVVSLLIVWTLGRDRSPRAEAGRAFRALSRTARLDPSDRRLLERGSRDAAVEPVACLLSVGAFDRVLVHAPGDFTSRLASLRERLFPEAGPPVLSS